QGAPTSPAADIYAVGALLQAVLTGPAAQSRPTAGQTAALTSALLEIAQRALDPDPAARYPSATLMRADLLALAGPLTLPAAPPRPAWPERDRGNAPALAPARRATRPRRRGRVAALLVAGGLILGGAAGTTALIRSSQSHAIPSPTIAALVPPVATVASP